jgi:hypothetical protein
MRKKKVNSYGEGGKNQWAAPVLSTPSTALTRLTNRSTRTIMLRIIAG